MGKLNSLKDAFEHFDKGGGGKNSFFTLKNDKESAVVRFLHEGEDDIDWYICHRVEIEGKPRYVQCTEEGDCPLCKSGNKPQLKIFLQLVDKRDGETKTWERGKNFVPVVMSFINRYGTLCGQPIEVERQGKPRDTNTQYLLYPLEKDNKTIADLPKRQQLLGENGFVLQKSHEDMQRIADGTFSYEPVSPEPEPKQREEKKGSDIF